jgi:hypothetical protein
MNMLAPFSNPVLIWTDVAAQASEMMFASVQVIAQRTGRMATAGALPDARDREEFALMSSEKFEAAGESAQNMALHIGATAAKFAGIAITQMVENSRALAAIVASGTPMQAATRQVDLALRMFSDGAAAGSAASGAAGHMVAQGLRPVHGRATRNAVRLAKN